MKSAVLKLVLALCALTGAVQAQNLTTFKIPVVPQPGVYYDPTYSGTGLTVDTIPLGDGSQFVFATYYHYTPNGVPTWMNFGVPVTQNSMAEYTATGVPAVLRSQWTLASGGQCFDCAYTPVSVSTPALGERVMNVIGARHIQLPASGNAATRNMRLSKALLAGGAMSRGVLEGGAIWAVKKRYFFNGIENNMQAGWIRFKKRVGPKSVFTGFDPAGLVPVPDFLKVAAMNDVDQYEVQCVRGGPATSGTDGVGSCSTSELEDTAPDGFDSNSVTFLIDPTNDRIRLYVRCSTRSNSTCPSSSPSYITHVGDVIEAAPTAGGGQRLVIRRLVPASGGWHTEYELTRVSDDLLSWLYPNGVPN